MGQVNSRDYHGSHPAQNGRGKPGGQKSGCHSFSQRQPVRQQPQQQPLGLRAANSEQRMPPVAYNPPYHNPQFQNPQYRNPPYQDPRHRNPRTGYPSGGNNKQPLHRRGAHRRTKRRPTDTASSQPPCPPLPSNVGTKTAPSHVPHRGSVSPVSPEYSGSWFPLPVSPLTSPRYPTPPPRSENHFRSPIPLVSPAPWSSPSGRGEEGPKLRSNRPWDDWQGGPMPCGRPAYSPSLR